MCLLEKWVHLNGGKKKMRCMCSFHLKMTLRIGKGDVTNKKIELQRKEHLKGIESIRDE